ncbi:glycosyltransferase family 8 protein [Jaapia argillacea MUCL 33604]|uniref:Glycosyltransferase family 8 protein n=1 Tax=Jaapia argillacea MUCL 33604 TaxID=933084 RepID=A0A067QJC3_9AGAM|nr:glycosyltransferase family 8 protein [Jaapia argillacea MUCL 33604]
MHLQAAYVTLLTSTSYLPGTLVLDYSLKSVDSKFPLVVMVTPDVPSETIEVLRKRGIAVKEVNKLEPGAGSHALSSNDARFTDTWTKLRGFQLVEFDRVVLLDSDMIVMKNMDELMDLELPKDWIAAAHVCACNPRKIKHYPLDWIPENCAYTPLSHPTALTSPTQITPTSPRPYALLNSGTVVLTPSHELMHQITQYLCTSPLVPSFSFPDQDLLSHFFKDRWKPLPWCFNALKTLRVIHKPLWRDEEIRCLHYILNDKPWHYRAGDGGFGPDYEEMNRWWWDRFDHVGEEIQRADAMHWKLVSSLVGKT